MQIECEIQIQRQPADVFAFLTDPDKLPQWQSSTVAVRRRAQGPLTVGERFDEVHKALGRELSSTVEVAAYEDPRLFALNIVDGAIPLDGRWELEPRAGGTRLRFTGQAELRGPLRMAKPMLTRRFRGYHDSLRELLENGVAET